MKDRIKELRKKLRLSQREFGEKLSLSTQTICAWEHGKNVPMRGIKQMCSAFHVRQEWLQNGEGEIFDPRHGMIVDPNEPNPRLAAWTALMSMIINKMSTEEKLAFAIALRERILINRALKDPRTAVEARQYEADKMYSIYHFFAH